MLRNTFLTLSQSSKLREAAVGFAPARAMSRRFVAGERLDQALALVQQLNDQGLLVTLDYLGENTRARAEADAYTNEQLAALDGLARVSPSSYVSLKLTAMGLDISQALATENLRRVLERAQGHGLRVRIDMESSDYVDRTLEIYRAMRAEGFDNVGTVLQSYLYRTERDLRALIDEGANLRLVKGAYDEPPHLAYPDKADVDHALVHLIQMMLSEEARAKGCYCAVASHDPAMLDATKRYVAEHDVPLDAFEFQMLYGIATSMHHQLAAEGYRFRVYVPYGTHWWPYYMRRLAERPANVLFIAKSLFRN